MNCHHQPIRPADRDNRSGAALIVALWVLLILAILLSGFAFDMQVETSITDHARKRVRAQAAAEAGVAYAKMLLAKSRNANNVEESDETLEAVRQICLRVSRGLDVTCPPLTVGDASVTVRIQPETGRRNVNRMTEEDWGLVLEEGMIPEELQPELIDAFFDWTDGNELRRLHGAESDDPFYVDKGYKVKNGPVDTLEELRWIKGFTSYYLDGGVAPDDGSEEPVRYPGILRWLTVWGDDNRVNVNTASREVLMTLPGMTEAMADEILVMRMGLDGIEGTEDDGFQTQDDALTQIGIVDPAFQERISVGGRRFVRLNSVADIGGVKSGIWAVFSVSGNDVLPVYWREEPLP